MKLISEDWEIVSRKTNHFWLGILDMILFEGHSEATWTVRQGSTGITRRVTAYSKSEAADKIAKGSFDSDEEP
jgi:hypothetical protein